MNNLKPEVLNNIIDEFGVRHNSMNFTMESITNPGQMSVTLTGIAGMLAMMIKLIFKIEIPNEQIDLIVNALVTLITTGAAIYGYFRARKTVQETREELVGAYRELGAVKRQLGQTEKPKYPAI